MEFEPEFAGKLSFYLLEVDGVLKLPNDNPTIGLLLCKGTELLADRNNVPLILVKFKGKDKSAISERSDYEYRCIITSYDKIKNRLQAENICISDTTVRPRKDTIPFDEEVLNKLKTENVGLSVGLNVGLNKTEKKVISLQNKKVIERIGSKRDGSWIVIQ